MNIRAATRLDKDAIYSVHWAAFSEEERKTVAQLAVDLLLEQTAPRTVSLVAEIEENIVGHAAFSPATVVEDDTFLGFILSPLGVAPKYQKQRLGTKLVESGLQEVSSMGADVVFVYGDPNYYGQFGFSAQTAKHYVPPYQLQHPYGWQAIAISDRAERTTPINLVVVNSLRDSTLW